MDVHLPIMVMETILIGTLIKTDVTRLMILRTMEAVTVQARTNHVPVLIRALPDAVVVTTEMMDSSVAKTSLI